MWCLLFAMLLRGPVPGDEAMHVSGSNAAEWLAFVQKPAVLASVLGLFGLGLGTAAAADDWMTADAMRTVFNGVTLEGKYGSGRPFTESYGEDGRLSYREGHKTIGGKWSVEAGTFCTIYDNDPAGGCYRVRQVTGNCFEFYFVARTEDQAKADPKSPSWTARGSIVGKPGVCAEQHSV